MRNLISPNIDKARANQKECIDELLPDMHVVTIYRKDKVKPYGIPNPKWTLPLKFQCFVFDGFNNFKCIFDACHDSCFDVGDEIGFTFKVKEGFFNDVRTFEYRIYKKHKIYNISKSENKERKYIMRPPEEIKHLQKKANKRYEEIKQSLSNHPPTVTAVSLRNEKKDLVKLMGMLHYAETGKIIEHPEVNPKTSFVGCGIITRYFGNENETFASLLERAERRFETVSQNSSNTKEGEEFINLRKLIIALKWMLDQVKDTQIGLNFGWAIFGKKIQDDFKLHGKERDEYLIPDRAREDKNFIINEIQKNDEKVKDRDQEEKLKSKFKFLQKHGFGKKGK